MFWAKKITCDRCEKKVKAKVALYYRSATFCSVGCRDAWEVDNPAPVARGTSESIRREAIVTIDEAIVEYRRAFGLGPLRAYDGRQVVASIAGAIAGLNQAHNIEARNEALTRFHTFALRCPPLLRALGHREEAMRIDSTDIMTTVTTALTAGAAAGKLRPIVDALVDVRSTL